MTYLPYTWAFATDSATATEGQNYYRIATVSVTGETEDEAIEFYVSRRFDAKPVKLAFRFVSTVSTDPPQAIFYYDDLNGTSGGVSSFEAFTYKTSTSVWDIYVHKAATSDRIAVRTFVPPWMQEQVSVTYAYNKLDTIPAGATMAIPTHYQLGYNNAKIILFEIAGNTARKLAGANGGECAWLLSCTGWNTNIRSGLWYISGYNDSSRADITALKSASAILINPVANELAWTITNNSVTKSLFSCTVLYGALPTIT